MVICSFRPVAVGPMEFLPHESVKHKRYLWASNLRNAANNEGCFASPVGCLEASPFWLFFIGRPGSLLSGPSGRINL